MDEWFWPFVAQHRSRFPRGDWPAAEAEYWKELRHLFVTKGVTQSVAEEASRLLFEAPPEFVSDHPAALIEKARAVWKATAVKPDAASDRDEALRQSLACPECSGNGLAGRRAILADGLEHWAAFYCHCPMGRWIEANHRTKAPDIRRRMTTLADRREPHAERDDAAAMATWASLDETEREVWRRLARQRIPMFRGESSELLAIAWAHDPASVIPLPPPRDAPTPIDRRGPRRLFDPIEKV